MTRGRNLSEAARQNQPPTLDVRVDRTVTLPATLALTANVTDDGLPKEPTGPRPRAVGQETPPLLQPRPGAPEAPKNVPHLNVNARGRQLRPQAPHGLSVAYMVWRGPAGVTFEPSFAEVKDGTAVTTAEFSTPGTYVLRARAMDGRISLSAAGNPSGDAKATVQDITVVVQPSPSAGQP